MLYRKAVRAILQNKKAYISCIYLIMMGIILYTAMNVAVGGLALSRDKFYTNYNLADVYAKVKGIPVNAADIFTDIEGIHKAQLRNVTEMRAEVEGSDATITMRLISLDESYNEETYDGLNNLIVTGNPIVNDNEILVNSAFFKAHNFKIGDPIKVFYGGREQIYYVNGTALSPEYAYITKSTTDILPDEEAFGIGYVSNRGLSSLTQSQGLANDLVFSLQDGYVFDDVKIQLEDALKPYGLTELYEKKNQTSFSFLDLEITAITSMAKIMPIVFMLMAMVVMYLMMKRVIEQERTQVGTLKAFGYSNAEILRHYMVYGVVTGLSGGLFGFIVGYFASGVYLSLFLQFFMLPSATNSVSLLFSISAILLGTISGVLGALMGALKALNLNPAEAMRPESPKHTKFDIIGKIKALKYVLNSGGHMALRNIMRSPVRSGFIVIGVTLSFSLLTIVGSLTTIIDKMIYGQFEDILLYEVKVPLKNPQKYGDAIETAYSIDGVTTAEGILEIPAVLKNKHLKEGIVVTGVDKDSKLYAITDTNSKVQHHPPTEGVILTNGIAQKLNAKVGDKIYLSSQLLEKDTPVYVTNVIEQNLGSGCYMEISALSDFLNMPKTATSLILNTDDLEHLKQYTKTADNVLSIEDKESTLQKYKNMLDLYSSIFYVLDVMGVLIAFAIIYNTSTISLSERKREYATLRVLGLTVKEVCEIMDFEYWALSIIGMIIGIPFAKYLISAINSILDMSLFSMPSTLPLSAYITGIVGCSVAIILSGLSAKKRISTFDMVEVLKERE